MAKRLLTAIVFSCLFVWPTAALDLLRICSAYYPGGCSLHVYDYSGTAYDFHALWCGSDLIYESGGFGGSIGSHGNCRYFL